LQDRHHGVDDFPDADCFLRKCPIDFRCMKAVSVQEVVDAVMSILQLAPSPQAREKHRM